MERRELLKLFSLAPVVSSITGTAVEGKKIESGHYMLFYNAAAIDIGALLDNVRLPDGVTMDFISCKLFNGEVIDDVVRIYRVENP